MTEEEAFINSTQSITGPISKTISRSGLKAVYEELDDKEKAMEIFHKVLPFFVFEMQSLEMFIKCTKTVLFKKGLISSNETRFDLELSPVAKSILERHFVQLMEVEQQFKGANNVD